jgi:hypothetical protein
MKREELTDEDRDALRGINTASRRIKREELSDEDRDALRGINTASRRIKRDELSDEDRESIRVTDTANRRVKREKLEEEFKAVIGNVNNAARRNRRLNETDYERACRLNASGRVVHVCSQACVNRHVLPNGAHMGCGSALAGHLLKYQVCHF